MVAVLQASTHPNISKDTLDTQYRRMAGRDGIREDRTGVAFRASLGTSSPTVTIVCGGRSILVDGNLCTFSSDAVLDPREIGVPPTGNQLRLDRVVARYDTAVPILKDRGRLAILPGTPSTSPGATPLTRNLNGVFEVPVCRFRLPSSGLLSGLVMERVWSGDLHMVEPDVSLEELDFPLGSQVRRGGVTWHRELVGNKPTWVDLAGGQRAWRARRAAPDFLPSPAEGEVAGVQVATVAGATYAVAGTVIHSAATRNGLSVRCKAAGVTLESYPTTSLTEKTSDPVFGDFVGTGATVAVQVTAQRDGGSAPITVHDGSHVRVWRVN